MYAFYIQLKHAQTAPSGNGYWKALAELTRRLPISVSHPE